MEKTLLIIQLLEEIRNNNFYDVAKKIYNINIFLFGSVLYKHNPNDIDILILYPRCTKYIEEVLEFKNDIKKSLEHKLLIDVDMVILSYEEEKEIEFIKNEGAIEINWLMNNS